MKRALIITGQGFQDDEVTYPYYFLKGQGFAVDIAAKEIGEIQGIIGRKILANKSFSEINIDNYDLLVLPGGVKALEKVRQEPSVIDFIYKWDSRGKIIACVCHGAQLMISAKIVKGRKISAYYSIKDDVNNAGAEYVDAPFVVDRNIISSPHYKYLGEWMNEVIRRYKEHNNS